MVKKKVIATKGRSKSTAPTFWLINENTDREKDPDYSPTAPRTDEED